MFAAYRNIWLCGLAASGKTTITKMLYNHVSNAKFYNDSLEIIKFINNDTDQKHHHRPTPDSFVLTDSEPVYHSVDKLIDQAQTSSANKVIEISRGHDQKQVVDLSYRHLFSNLTKDLKKNSLFIYIHTPLETRRKRNQKRPSISGNPTVFESCFCPKEAFDRFFLQDDFQQTVNMYPINYLFIPNIYSLKHLKHRVLNLFS